MVHRSARRDARLRRQERRVLRDARARRKRPRHRSASWSARSSMVASGPSPASSEGIGAFEIDDQTARRDRDSRLERPLGSKMRSMVGSRSHRGPSVEAASDALGLIGPRRNLAGRKRRGEGRESRAAAKQICTCGPGDRREACGMRAGRKRSFARPAARGSMPAAPMIRYDVRRDGPRARNLGDRVGAVHRRCNPSRIAKQVRALKITALIAEIASAARNSRASSSLRATCATRPTW